MKVNYKHIFILLVLIVLYLPIIQTFVPVVKEIALKGFFEKKTKPEISSENYFNGTYQEEYMAYLNDEVPLKATITRIYNQILYSIFNQTNVVDLKIGKEGYFYDHPYIKEYFGEQYNGYNINADKVKRLVKINDCLNKMSKKMIIVFAPGKASMFPQYIPDQLTKEKTDSTNYFVFKREFEKNKLNYIDFRDYFNKYNDTTNHTIIGKLGVHWTKYAAHLASDSIVRMMEELTNTDIVDKIYKYNEVTARPRDEDDDIAQSMNLLWNPEGNIYTYPIVEYNNLNKVKPKVSVIADSFWWTINGNQVPWNQFSECYFMYYFKHTYDLEKEIKSEVNDEDLLNYINKSEYIILMSTEANLGWFPYGFIEQFERVYFQKNN